MASDLRYGAAVGKQYSFFGLTLPGMPVTPFRPRRCLGEKLETALQG